LIAKENRKTPRNASRAKAFRIRFAAMHGQHQNGGGVPEKW
jgi:hypothetical protein